MVQVFDPQLIIYQIVALQVASSFNVFFSNIN